MKKIISFLLATAMTAVVAMPAFAAHETVANDDGTWTTSGSDASFAGKMMTMVAYAPSEEGITVDSIQYIDQTVANASGAYAFENYIPQDLPTTGDYLVLVGGETLDEPADAGKVAALPASSAVHETVANGDGTWTTSGSSASFAGKVMTMVAYAPSEEGITVDSIQYIDQTVANASGAYVFDNYIPKNLPTTGDYLVLVGGETLARPADAGKIEKVQLSDVAVTGKATAIGDAAITVTFKQSNVNIPVNVVDGEFEAEVTPGTYDIVYTAAGYLSHTIAGVIIKNRAPALKDIKLLAGDVDGIGNVSIEDIGFVVGAYSDDTLYNITKDFDANGDVTIEDVGFAVANYKAEPKVEVYSAN